ncbi:MAG: polysaccharide deacetylase family protein [Lachnospiraceae bacterium]|nr:polysaccharide deacetylase family protein [Lachnospiraceae bacterium]
MFNKALTFSFDDGVESDKRLVELLNKYGLKCSFNLNSGLFGDEGTWDCNGFTVKRFKEIPKGLYDGHEILMHGLHHLNPNELSEEELNTEFGDDIKNLEAMFNCKIEGMAYAYGCYNDTVVNKLKKMGIKYARTVWENHSFELQKDMLRFRPTCHFLDKETKSLVKEFLNNKGSGNKVFYIWGHSYEIDGNNAWDYLEDIFKELSGRDGILYGTNTEVFKYFGEIDQ